jgi:hypothetical protein
MGSFINRDARQTPRDSARGIVAHTGDLHGGREHLSYCFDPEEPFAIFGFDLGASCLDECGQPYTSRLI